MSYAELDKLIKDNQEAKSIQKQQSTVKVKQEPIGQVRKSKIDAKSTKTVKDSKRQCIRCGDKWSMEHMELCPAKEKKCNYCKKSGHLQNSKN